MSNNKEKESKRINIFDDNTLKTQVLTLAFIGTASLTLAGGVIGSNFGEIAGEVLDTPDSTPRLGEQIAITEYNGLFNLLSVNDTKVAKSTFGALAKEFHTKAILDKRLSEATVEELFSRFDKEIGNFEEIAGIATPDFSDIDSCRVEIEPRSFQDIDATQEIEAKIVNLCSKKINDDEGEIIGTLIGTTAFLSLALIGFGAGLRQEYKKSGTYKRRNGLSRH